MISNMDADCIDKDISRKRNEIAERIIDIAYNYDGKIYGQYVRDKLAGIDFVDIDIITL